MPSTHDTTDPVDHDADWYRDQLQIARAALQACDAALRLANDRLDGGVGHQPGSNPLRIAEASDQLRAILAVPDERPGAWEADAVRKLDGQLRDVLHVLHALEGEDVR